jgi:PAS domain S-box-containing protein
LSEAALPKGSIVINRESRIWDYKYYLIGGLALFLVQLFLIAGLLLQRRRKKVAEEELNQFFNVSLDLKCIANTDGYFLRLNPAWKKILGYTREELMAKRFLEFVHPDDLDRTREAVSTLSSQQEVISFENRYRCKDGTYRWLEWSSSPAGNLIFAAARDVTERKRAEAEASNARRELLRMERLSRMGELTASLAHELNQPLTAILSNAQAALRFIQSGNPDLNELGEILQDISNDDKRAGSVIRSLRGMMKQEEREREPLSINDILSEVVSLFHSEAVLRNVNINMEFTESLPTVLADKIQLEQVVLNLMMNATEAMDQEAPESRKIFLKTRRADHGTVQVAVRDWGPGIEEEKLDRVFQPFFTTKGAGLGMGLSISRSIIEAHGGRLWAENNRDKGATFFFEIPVISKQ